MNYEVVIENGWIVDGKSNQVRPGKIGISGGKIGCIAAKDTKLSGEKTLDASDMIVAPGFIDTNVHSDQYLLLDPIMKNKLLQGVTTEIGGSCGDSAFPWTTSNRFFNADKAAEFGWNSFGGFLSSVEARGIALNYGSMIGHNCVHYSAGLSNGGSTPKDRLARMKRVVAGAMDQGAFGLSAGMSFLPASLNTTNDLIELSKEVARKGGMFSAHLRSESTNILDSLSEVISIGIMSGAPIEISHFKVLDRPNWPKQENALNLIYKMRAAGMNLSASFFPYNYVCAPLKVMFPPWIIPNGKDRFAAMCSKDSTRKRLSEHLSYTFPNKTSFGAVRMPHSFNGSHHITEGLTVAGIARAKKKKPESVLMDIALTEGLDKFTYYECIDKTNIEEIARLKDSVVVSDSFPTGIPLYFQNSIIHPRTFGTFPEFLRTFVYEKHLMTLPEAIKKITSIPAERYGLKQRGHLAKGACADITIFDPEKLNGTADRNNPIEYSRGINHVIVNGRLVIEDGRYTGALPGAALRRNV